MFLRWEHYLRLCDQIGSTDYTPAIFVSSYNEALEKCGLSPVVYEIEEIGIGECFWRNGTEMQFEGIFPCDTAGRPIMKWIGLKIKNPGRITCKQDKSSSGRLFVELRPNTVIHALNYYNNRDDTDDFWYQIYAGPQTMEFDYEAMRDARKRLKYTQNQVADAVGASVRTYQKWESGETIPDGHYLMRFLNWLDLRDVQDLTKYKDT